MKAAVTRSFGEPLVIEDLALDPPGPDEVRVRVGAVAICGSDLHAIDGAWGGDLPAVYGHEAAGTVVATGPGAGGLEPGDRVVVSLLRTCERCTFCRSGEYHLCDGEFPLDRETRLRDAAGQAVAQGIRVGAFAEEVVVHHTQAVRVPAELAMERACLLACGVLTGYGAVAATAALPKGSSVAVIGVGGVGLNCLQAARDAGAHPIVAIDANDAKRDAALRFGATHWGPTGEAVDFAFVAAGSPAAVERALELVRPGGTVVVVGMTPAGVHARLELSGFAYGGKRILGSRMGSAHPARDIPDLAERHLTGGLLLDELITGRYPLEKISEAVASTRAGDALRNVVVLDA